MRAVNVQKKQCMQTVCLILFHNIIETCGLVLLSPEHDGCTPAKLVCLKPGLSHSRINRCIVHNLDIDAFFASAQNQISMSSSSKWVTSNQQTNPAYRKLSDHPFGKMMDYKLSITLCTDNRTVSNTTMTDEIHKAVTAFNLGMRDLKNLLVYGFKRSFFPGDYPTKRTYVRRCMDYFEKVEKEVKEEKRA